MNKPCVVLGGGGHASVLVEILLQQKQEILAIVSPELDEDRLVFHGITHLKDDKDVLKYSPEDIALVNGIGVLPFSSLRANIFEQFKNLGYTFKKVISDNAIVSPYAVLEEGVQVFPGAIINCGSRIGSNSIINTGACVEHDCVIGNHNHIAPKATICGGVISQNNSFIGATAAVIQNIEIGENVVIGAGAVVTSNVLDSSLIKPSFGTVKRVEINE